MKKSSPNHIFRTIWSTVLNAWVVVSELAKARGKRGTSAMTGAVAVASVQKGIGVFRLKRLSMVLLCCHGTVAFANPFGAEIVHGSAQIQGSGNVLTVTSTPNAIINWQGFSIGKGETTRFVQPSAGSSVLNRVVGPDPSALLGALESNGRVFLINPAGILVGQGARIDVRSFVASTLNLSDGDFLSGKLDFAATPNSGSVRNDGAITTPEGGQVYLIAPEVENAGTITAPGGDVLLAAGKSVRLADTSTPGVSVEITGTDTHASNLGQIIADSGTIGVLGAFVRNEGKLGADSLESTGGRIFLRANHATELGNGSRIRVTGSRGGSVEVLGQHVALQGDAEIDASGTNGGGTVLVGGDAHGANSAIQNAQDTVGEEGVRIRADALQSGDGGKVVVWADQSTRFGGSLSARGAGAGNGGFIETSGHFLDVAGIRIDAGSDHGAAGSWLLDPWNVTIAAAGEAGGAFATGTWTPGATGSTILDTTILGALDVGTAVIINTTGAGTEAGDITVNAALAMTGTTPTSLTLNAAGSIAINQGISSAVKGFPEAIETVFPKTDVQLCIVHLVRYSLNYVSWKLRKEVAADLRTIYSATTVEDAEQQLAEFEEKWGEAYPPIVQSWRRNWTRIIPFFDYPPEIRRVIYTTNAIESVNMGLRKITKNRGSFPSDEALLKLFYLALNNISKKWTMPIRDWKSALNRFTIQFEERMSQL